MQRVCTGTLSAEAQALEIGCRALTYVHRMCEFALGVRLPCDVRGDDKGLMEYLTSVRLLDDTRMAVQIEAVKEAIQRKGIRDCRHIAGEVNYADILTKSPPASIAPELCWELMGGTIRNVY